MVGKTAARIREKMSRGGKRRGTRERGGGGGEVEGGGGVQQPSLCTPYPILADLSLRRIV